MCVKIEASELQKKSLGILDIPWALFFQCSLYRNGERKQIVTMTATVGKDSSTVTEKSHDNVSHRPQSPSLDKYRKVEKPRESTPDDEIRVTGVGRVGKYVTYAAKLFIEQGRKELTIRATGKAISIAVSVCEVIKRRFKGLHQVTSIGWTEIVDHYEPLEEGLEIRTETRAVPSIAIFLTLDESRVDKKAVGYQPPLDESLVEERGAEELTNPRRKR